MAFRVPTFNLVCNIWHIGYGGNAPPLDPPNLSPTCNLQFARHDKIENIFGSAVSIPYLLIPKLTDIRGEWNGNAADVLEVPAGSDRYYQVLWVDDVAKGFTNEYRIAGIVQLTDPSPRFGFNFPVPLP